MCTKLLADKERQVREIIYAASITEYSVNEILTAALIWKNNIQAHLLPFLMIGRKPSIIYGDGDGVIYNWKEMKSKWSEHMVKGLDWY